MMLQHFVDATGFIALALNVSGLIGQDDRMLVKTSGWASAVWALNNLLIGAHAAAALAAISVGRQAIASTLQNDQGPRKTLAFAALVMSVLLAGVLTWNGIGTLFLLGGSVTATYAMFYLRGAGLRLAMVLVSVLWMYNAVTYGSWWQIAANVVAGGAAAVAAWRACPTTASACDSRSRGGDDSGVTLSRR
jgi:hypothetical protein